MITICDEISRKFLDLVCVLENFHENWELLGSLARFICGRFGFITRMSRLFLRFYDKNGLIFMLFTFISVSESEGEDEGMVKDDAWCLRWSFWEKKESKDRPDKFHLMNGNETLVRTWSNKLLLFLDAKHIWKVHRILFPSFVKPL